MRILLAILIAACFATSTMGRPLAGEGGKFAVANIGSIVFVALSSVLYFAERNSIRRDFLWTFIAFNASALLSFAIFLLRFHWDPNFLVLFFQDVEVAFSLLLFWYAAKNPGLFRAAVHLGIYCSIPIVVYFGLQDLANGKPFSTFGMDDHSHSAVMFCAEAFILCRFFGSPLDRIIGLGFFVASFLTISRLPVFFIPAIILSFSLRSKLGALLGVVFICFAGYMLVTAGQTVGAIFQVYNRVSSVQAISGEASTSTHFLLLKSALEMKFSDVCTFLFGIGPGNFSKAFTSFSPDTASRIASLDPQLFADAQVGKAPLHSVTVQTLLDYNLYFFLLIMYLLGRGFAFLARTRRYLELLFFAGLFASATFYSLHDKPYFYLVITTVAFLSLNAQRHPLAGVAPSGELHPLSPPQPA